jgi:threonine dehydrogenase-like Zn-dependent dehydrogenase
MKGYVFRGDKEVALIEKATPSPGPGQVLVKSKTSTICGSDLHYYRASKAARAASVDIFTGHEPVGEVVEVGPGVAWPAVGDRVVGYHVVVPASTARIDGSRSAPITSAQPPMTPSASPCRKTETDPMQISS